jgi:hypothetical protein
LIEIHSLVFQHFEPKCTIAIGGIGHALARESREEQWVNKLCREPSIKRHVAVIAALQVTRSLDQDRFTFSDRLYQTKNLRRSILVVSRHDYADVVAVFDGPTISSTDRRACAASLLMLDEHRSLFTDDFRRAIGRAVVEHGDINAFNFSKAIEH